MGHLSSSQSQEHVGGGGHKGYRKPNEIYGSPLDLSVKTKPEFVGSNRKKNYFSWRTSSHGIKVGSLILKKPLAATRQNTQLAVVSCVTLKRLFGKAK